MNALFEERGKSPSWKTHVSKYLLRHMRAHNPPILSNQYTTDKKQGTHAVP